MDSMQRTDYSITEETARFMAGVYKWMCIGILITFGIYYYVSITPSLIQTIVRYWRRP